MALLLLLLLLLANTTTLKRLIHQSDQDFLSWAQKLSIRYSNGSTDIVHLN